MARKPASASLKFIRSLAAGVLLSMIFFYSIHVLGDWSAENYRPDPETTSTLLLHNKCAILGAEHTLRPNTDISGMGAGIDGTKLAGSFMNFFDGHIAGMIILALLLGGIIFILRRTLKTSRQPISSP
jgi:hypothetical protein